MPDDKRFVPDFQLVVDGAAADPDLKGSVLGIRVTDDMDKSSRFWVHLSDAGRKWTKQSKFKPGTAIEIKLGYQGLLKSVCKGEVSNLELVLAANGPTRLIVSGVDKGHGFDKGTLTKTYKDVKDSDLAAQIAKRHGLSVEVDDSKVVHDYVIQNNLSDYDFLMQRAAQQLILQKAMMAEAHRMGFRVTDAELRATLEAAHRLMRGRLDGAPGSAQAYRRKGRPCPRCGTAIKSWPQGDDARMAYWCPECQRGEEPETA